MIVATLFNVVNAQQSLKNIKQKKARNEQVIRESNVKLNKNEILLSKQLDALNSLNARIEEQNNLIEKEQNSLDSINKLYRLVNDSISLYQQQLDVMKKQYAEAARQMYIRRGDMNDLAFIFSSESFKQAYRRMRYLKQFSKWRDSKTQEISELQNKLDVRKNRLSVLSAEKSQSIASINATLQALNNDKRDADKLVANLNKEKKALKSLIKKKEKEIELLDEDIERIIVEEQRRQEELRRQEEERKRKDAEERRLKEERRQKEIADSIKRVEEKQRQEAEKEKLRKDSVEKSINKSQPKEEKKKEPEIKKKVEEKIEKKVEIEQPENIEKKPIAEKKTSAQLTSGFRLSKGKLPQPVKGKYRVVRTFGQQKHPSLKYITTDSKGIYVETGKSSDIIAIYEGEVSRVLSHRTYNTIIIIRHGEYFTIYCNVDDTTIKEGDIVKQGQKIGSVFIPDGETNGILHFQIRCGREELNPTNWLK